MEKGTAKKKKSKKSNKADKGDDSSHEDKKSKGSGMIAQSPRQAQPPHPKATGPSAQQLGPMNMSGASPGGMTGFPGPGMDVAGLGAMGSGSLDMLAYQNLMRQRELQALREQAMGLQAGLGGAGSPGLLRGGMAGGPLGAAGMGYMDRSFGGLGGAGGLLPQNMGGAGAPGMALSPGGAFGGLDAARSGLTPEEQLFLLRRNQEEMDLSLRQRLELMQQQQQQARQMQLMELQQQQQQQQQFPPELAMMQERQRFLERQRLEQLLASQGGAPGGY